MLEHYLFQYLIQIKYILLLYLPEKTGQLIDGFSFFVLGLTSSSSRSEIYIAFLAFA